MAGRSSRARASTPPPVRTARPLDRITYPAGLPVVDRKEDIAGLIAANQVVIVAGETGSGKTTQLPKICLELGRGVEAMIGHTQPRRIAARAVAERLAEELSVRLGGPVGYAVRFSDQVGPETLVKVMTDGILLAELQRDRELRRYDTIIVDEAHERSLNIDFLLGYLRSSLPRRPDLKVIITSATIDTARFARHFDAPVVEVSGRTYPVELRYRPVG
ncbi:MAG TPA: DEAD/DEAH box helicase, partial [Acidimicrobiales bacterium]|nr:DEAD/DEAH box helicase [Acidimicrobiales bacterium]